jgi:purine-cytosine permease-like protein
MGILLIVAVIVLAPKFHALPAASASGLLLGHYWPTWILSFSTAASLPISYAPYIGDYTRYVSPVKWSQRQVMTATAVGMFIGCAVALCFAIYVSMSFPANITDWVVGLVDTSPTGGSVPIVLIALVGSCAQGALCVYGTGMDTSSIVPRLKRVPATILIGILGTVLVYIGSFAYNLVSATSSFMVLLLVVTAPWMIINVIGYMLNHGRYYAHDLQVFNMRPHIRGGAYWFIGGWSLAGLIAWVVSTVVGMMFVNTSLFVGPWANAAGGIDFSFASALVLGALIYYVLAKLIPGSIIAPAQVSEKDDARRLTALIESRRAGDAK